MTDDDFMDLAMQMADSCKPARESIPKVGCAIAIDQKLIAHSKRGEDDHAEKIAMAEAESMGHDLSAVSVYTTLEPCTHHSRRNPGESCTERLIAARVRKVLVGALDPNQDVCGRGVLALQRAGIEVGLFPYEKTKSIQQSNANFVRVQQTLGLSITYPEGSRHTVQKGRRHDIGGEYINKPDPGELHVMVGNRGGVWWPQPFEFQFNEDKTWKVTIDLTNRGEYVVAVVRANNLGRAFIDYFDRIQQTREKNRRELVEKLNALNPEILQKLEDPDLRKNLGTDWTGMSMSLLLPKGLDMQVWQEYKVE